VVNVADGDIDFCLSPPNFNPATARSGNLSGKECKLLTVLSKGEGGIVANQSSATPKSKSHFWEETIQ
jgi:hypothetical protein